MLCNMALPTLPPSMRATLSPMAASEGVDAVPVLFSESAERR